MAGPSQSLRCRHCTRYNKAGTASQSNPFTRKNTKLAAHSRLHHIHPPPLPAVAELEAFMTLPLSLLDPWRRRCTAAAQSAVDAGYADSEAAGAVAVPARLRNGLGMIMGTRRR